MGAMRTTVYVVSYSPANEDIASVGGFWWFWEIENAEREYVQQVQDSARSGGSHLIRLLAYELPCDLDRGGLNVAIKINTVLDADLEHLETTGAPLRQYVPPTMDPAWVPTGAGARTIRHHPINA